MTGSADLVFWKVAPKNASVDVQLEALRENVETLKTQQDKLRSSVSEKTRVIEEAVAEESKLRKEATKELSDRMDALGVGGLNVEAAGIFWLTLGVIMATLPGELANFLAWLR